MTLWLNLAMGAMVYLFLQVTVSVSMESVSVTTTTVEVPVSALSTRVVARAPSMM